MAFAFKQRNDIEGQVRKIARKQIEKALEECRGTDDPFDVVVHNLRRHCKKLRGLVQLIRPHFKDHKKENRAFRDVAQALAGTRDATVMVETFTALLGFDRDQKHGSTIQHGDMLLDWLRGQVGVPPNVSEQAEILADFAKAFESAGKRAKSWSLSGSGFERIGDGLEDTYRLMRTGLREAEREGTPEALHEWRKQTKYHWHHVSLLEQAAPDVLGPRKACLDRLGELLGDHHNLAVLDDTLRRHKEAASKADLILVRKAVAQWQGKLADGAFELGRQLAAEKPSMLRDRFEQYWSLLPKKD